jgi:hypothetical protein
MCAAVLYTVIFALTPHVQTYVLNLGYTPKLKKCLKISVLTGRTDWTGNMVINI